MKKFFYIISKETVAINYWRAKVFKIEWNNIEYISDILLSNKFPKRFEFEIVSFLELQNEIDTSKFFYHPYYETKNITQIVF